MSTKQEQLKSIQEQIKTLQSTVNNLEKDIQEDEAKGGRVFGFLPEAGSKELYYSLGQSQLGSTFGVLATTSSKHAFNGNQEKYKGLFWKTAQEADNFAKAMNTFLELRTLEGVKGFERGRENHVITNCTREGLETDTYTSLNSDLSPTFSTRALAKQAINALGAERLTHMFNTLSGTL